jgi:hypothetical protein
MTKSPVALSIADCAAVPAVVSGTKAKVGRAGWAGVGGGGVGWGGAGAGGLPLLVCFYIWTVVVVPNSVVI